MSNETEKISDYLSPEEQKVLNEINHRAKENKRLISNLSLQNSSDVSSEIYRLKQQIEFDKNNLDLLKQKATVRRTVKKARATGPFRQTKVASGKFYALKEQLQHQKPID